MQKVNLCSGAAALVKEPRRPADICGYLARDDKWYLGGGAGACFAPCFPQWLDVPGFWDEAFLADVRLDRLFTVFLLEEGNARPIPLRREGARCWTPAALAQTWVSEDGAWQVREDKVVTQGNTFASHLTVHNRSGRARTLHLLLWSLQERNQIAEGATGVTVDRPERRGERLLFRHRVHDNRASGELTIALGTSLPVETLAWNLAEKTATHPRWDLSVFPEKFRGGRLAPDEKFRVGWKPTGLLHLALHAAPMNLAAGEVRSFTVAAAAGFDEEKTLAALEDDFSGDPVAHSASAWAGYFASVPWFTCSDPYLTKYYWYRWYGLRLSTVDVGTSTYPYPCIFEGVGMFRNHISYSAQCHMRETSWMHRPLLARGSLLDLIAHQREDGALPGHVWTFRTWPGCFYHADWGGPVLQLDALHSDPAFLQTVYEPLCRYADYFDRERDPSGTHLYDVVDQNETGQEYMSRYLFADLDADDWRPFRLKGVDATVYLYLLQQSLARIADRIGRPRAEADAWRAKGEGTRRAIREKLWDPARSLFFDVAAEDPARHSPYAAAVGFYPFLTDAAGPEHLSALEKYLFDAEAFWTEYPVPASPKTDPCFSAEAEWRGKRTNCPWNGRTWPMTDSHLCDALARVARLSGDPGLARRACELLEKFVCLMFWDRDAARPNCYEHYNPTTGEPSAYRGVDDYMHSWVVDLILRHVVGVQPPVDAPERLTIAPLPFELDRFEARDIRIRERHIDVLWQDGLLRITVDGRERFAQPGRAPVEITL